MSNTSLPREISFDEIRKGDRIRVPNDPFRGVTDSSEGIAHSISGSCWLTREGGIIADVLDDTITLLDRLETPSLPTEEGALILAYRIRGLTYGKPLTLRRSNRGCWVGVGSWVNEQGYDILSWAPLTPGPAVEVVNTPAEITFDEIQVGDTIRVTYPTSPDGFTSIVEGVADRLSLARAWTTERGGHIVRASQVGSTITLLDRAAALPTEEGALILINGWLAADGTIRKRNHVYERIEGKWVSAVGSAVYDDQIISWSPVIVGERVGEPA